MSFQQQPDDSINPRGPPGGGPSSSRSAAPCVQCCPENLNQNYQRRSASLSHAIMTLALLSASAAQLRFVVAYSHAHAYPTLNYFLICSCIIIEVIVAALRSTDYKQLILFWCCHCLLIVVLRVGIGWCRICCARSLRIF